MTAGRRAAAVSTLLVGVAALFGIWLLSGVFAPAVAPPPDWRIDPREPYPFTTPVPPLLATSIDGIYDREPTENYPDRPSCTRCQPFPLDGGRSVLTFRQGRYYLEQKVPRYRTFGHYEVDGARVTLFNDPECGAVRGTYDWQLAGGRLTLTVVEDECGFGQRARDMTDVVWQVLEQAPAT